MRYHRNGMIVEAFKLEEPTKGWPVWADELLAKVKKAGLPVQVPHYGNGSFKLQEGKYGDWVVYKDDGELYVYPDDQFRLYYEKMA